MLFFYLSSLSTLTCYFRVHRAGSQLKMSVHQTKAGNLKRLQNLPSIIHSLSTCWTTFVFMSMLKSHCLRIGEDGNAFFTASPTTPVQLNSVRHTSISFQYPKFCSCAPVVPCSKLVTSVSEMDKQCELKASSSSRFCLILNHYKSVTLVMSV